MKRLSLLLCCVALAVCGDAQVPPGSPGVTKTQAQNLSKGSPVTIVVAASDSSAAAQATANYVCTGSGDQSTINTAIAALPSAGGTVLLRVGTYSISGKITWDRSYVNLEGEGHPTWGSFNHGWTNTSSPAGNVGTNSAHIAATATGFNLIEIDSANLPDGGENRHRGNRVAHLYLTGDAYSSIGISTGAGYNITAGNGAGMDTCVFEDNFIQRVATGMSLSLDSGMIRGNNVQDCSGNCLDLAGYGIRVHDNTFFDCGGNGVSGFASSIGGAGFNIYGNEFGDLVDGVYLDGCSYCNVHGNIFNDGSTAMLVGILTEGGTGHSFTGNNFGYPGSGSATAPKTAIQVGSLGGTITTGVSASGNVVFGSGSADPQYAIAFWNGTGAAVGNSITGTYDLNGSLLKTILAPSTCQILGNFGDNNSAPVGGPAITTPMIAWWHADALSLSNGANVTTWLDSSGHAINLAYNTAAPIFTTNAVNSLPAVTFNGSSTQLVTTNPENFPQPWCVFVVAEEATTSAVTTLFACNNASLYIDASQKLALYAGTFTPGIGPTITTTSWHVYEASFNGASSFVDTDGTGNQTTMSQGSNALGLTGYSLGSGYVNGGNWNGSIAEVIVYPALLSSGDRATIRQYLEAKYAISGS